MQTKEIPVLLLTGYLGSGKTTLVNHILSTNAGIEIRRHRQRPRREMNIDAELIQKAAS